MTKQRLFYSPEENHIAIIYTEKFGQMRIPVKSSTDSGLCRPL